MAATSGGKSVWDEVQTYAISMGKMFELNTRFEYHAPHSDQVARYEGIRAAARALAQVIVGWTPESREQNIALTKLEEAVMWANAAIARREQ